MNTLKPELPRIGESEGERLDLRANAVSGSAWTAAVSVANKVLTALATLLVAQQLGPEDYGLSGVAASIACALVVVAPLSVSDVLVSGSGRGLVDVDANRLAWRTGLISTTLFLATAWPASLLYRKYDPSALVPLLIVLSLRPLLDAWSVAPLTELRIRLRFRAIALTDGAVQALATAASVGMAFAGFGAMSLVAPQVAAQLARAIVYRAMASPRSVTSGASKSRELWRSVTILGLGQYAHNFLFVLDVLILGVFADDAQSGYFTFAFLLASQANAVVSFQIGAVLQATLSKLQHDPQRQAAAYVRTLRSMATMAVPICLTQAAIGHLAFSAAFDAKWQPAAAVFCGLSVAQAFFFAASPTIAMLKAQGRFKTYLLWQLIQGFVSIPVFVALARTGGAFAVSVATAVIWAISLTFMVVIACRPAGMPAPRAIEALLRPWLAPLLVAPLAFLGAESLRGMQMGIALGMLAVIAVLSLVASVLLQRLTYPAAWEDFRSVLLIRGKPTRVPV